jgi:hypothetical protein
MKKCRTCKYWDTKTDSEYIGYHPCLASQSDHHGDQVRYGFKFVAASQDMDRPASLHTNDDFGCVEHRPVEHNPFDTAK